ncbi:MAG: murein biosynthesis integral membrane protein MurJ [Corynebacterium sp.]|nr:murein biosynthesis integral membrane protein MurJ [Corynebacterium sp.]
MTSAEPAPVPEIPTPVASPVVEDRSQLTHFYGKASATSTATQDAPATEHNQSAAADGSPLATTSANDAAATGDTDGDTPGTSDSDVIRSTGSMAIATLFSRITGFLRNVMITATLGGAIASAFNTANTLPNLITEIVLGAVLTSLVVPVLVRAEKEDPDRGEAFIRRLFTLAATVLGVVTFAAIVGAPLLMQMMLSSESKVNITQATSFAYLLLPQIFFYGMFALLMAVLNTKEVFKPGAWAPVANNVITLAVLTLYIFVPGNLHPDDPAGMSDPHILLLGLGTTLGVVVQALIMIPPIRKAGINLKPLWGIDDRLKTFGGMAVAIIVYVAISQFGYVITTRIAASSHEAAPNIYQQHWLLLQVPYGIIGVTLLTAIMPRLSRNAANGDDKAVVHDLNVASKLTMLVLIPIVVFFTVFGEMIAQALFAYGNFDFHLATILGWTLSFSAFTLIPYALVLLHLRVFYAREEAWTPTAIIAAITVTKVILSTLAPLIASSPERVVVLLGAANGFGFVAGAFIGGLLLRRKLGNLGMGSVLRTSGWALGASLIAVGVCYLLSHAIRHIIGIEPMGHSGPGSLHILVHLMVVGVIFLVITIAVLSRSGLEELASVSSIARRIPGLNRLVRPAAPMAHVAEGSSAPTTAETTIATNWLAFDDTFNATPVPPPMSAGIVRGPRLVPGARVSDGRFRLLADHGSVPKARFWHAQELSTGREVALVFVDTSGSAPQAPASPAAAAGLAAEITRRTRKLGALEHPAIAANIEVLSYRNGCLVVADWVMGTSLAKVAAAGADPYAAAYAFAGLSSATEAAANAHIPLGLDNRARIRINTSGNAVLAFPAVLPDASAERDQAGIRTALGSLIDPTTAPPEVQHLFEIPVAQLPEALEERPDHEDVPEEHLVIAAEDTPQPSDKPGFGAKRPSRFGLLLLTATIVAVVLILAAISSAITGWIGKEDPKAPIGSPELTTSKPIQRSIVANIADMSAFALPTDNISATATETAGLANGSGSWSSGTYDDALGTTDAVPRGVGLLVRLEDSQKLTHVILETNSTTTNVQIFGFTEDPTGLEELPQANLLGQGSTSNFRTSIELQDSKDTKYVVVWFNNLAKETAIEVSRLQLIALAEKP